jgi:hypothetical protein
VYVRFSVTLKITPNALSSSTLGSASKSAHSLVTEAQRERERATGDIPTLGEIQVSRHRVIEKRERERSTRKYYRYKR